MTAKSTVSPVSTLLASTACAASNASTRTSTIDVRASRYVMLYIKVTAAAASNQVELFLAGTAHQGTGALAAPSQTSDNWYPVAVTDGSITTGALAGAKPTSATFTAAPGWSRLNYGPAIIRTVATTNSTDIQEIALKCDVEGFRWMYVAYAQVDGGSAPSIAISYAHIL